MDLLQKKLDSGTCDDVLPYARDSNSCNPMSVGIQFSAFVPLYKNQPNNAEGVALCQSSCGNVFTDELIIPRRLQA